MVFKFYAPNVHAGGGLILMENVLREWPLDVACSAFLDFRAKGIVNLPPSWTVEWCTPSVLGRLRAEWRLAREVDDSSVTLCFHNLPPLLPIRGRVLCLVQNRHVIDTAGLIYMDLRVRLRTKLESWLTARLSDRIHRYFVQTPSMARKVAMLRNGDFVDVVISPFASLEIESILAEPVTKPLWDFIYVADGQVHKNHRRLLEAWKLLDEQGIRPSLALTLGPRDRELATELINAANRLNIVNLGLLPHDELMKLYRQARALIFPSTIESFGLPLVEAAALRLPILAPELDYVRDVCVPTECFDPFSAISIARAVRRFLGKPELPITPEVPSSFVSRVIAEAQGR
jgi:glycosyltransferase involved in cell wall biosynthesis